MTFAEYKTDVNAILLKRYGVGLDTLDDAPLYDWFIKGWPAHESAATLIKKDGFDETSDQD